MEILKSHDAKRTPKVAVDEQTGKAYELEPEKLWDVIAATFSILYLIGVLLFLCWLLIDLVSGRHLFLMSISTVDISKEGGLLSASLFRLVAFTVIGGGMGGGISGIRSIIMWHAERKAFGWRFVWKYVTLPLVGIIMSAMVYAIIRGGIAVFAGTVSTGTDTTIQGLSAFALGALTGYGSHKVFIWLDTQVNKVFKISPVAETKVPDLIGKTQEEAEAALKEASLNLGKIEHRPSEDASQINKVIEQNPAPDTMICEGSSVDITIAIEE